MKSIRPHEFFRALKQEPASRIAHIKLPLHRDLWTLETALLITAIRLVDARRIFEFGTFFGSTTLNLALNSPEDAEVFTLDLPPERALASVASGNDTSVATERLERAKLDFEGLECSSKIRQLIGNSREFDFSPFTQSIDLVFIDGGHDRETVKSDTKNAFRMVRRSAPAFIFWHDYRNPAHPENTSFLDELSRDRELTHIEDTLLVFLSF